MCPAIDSGIVTGDATGADPGFFLGGGALVSCCTSTPINHKVFFCRIIAVLENRRSSQVEVRTPCTLPLDPPLRYWPTVTVPEVFAKVNSSQFPFRS